MSPPSPVTDAPSYLQLLSAELTGIELGTADTIAVATLGAAAVLSMILNVHDCRHVLTRAFQRLS